MSMEAHVSTTLHRTRTNVNSSHLATSKELDTNKDIESNYSATPGNHNLRWLSFGFWATDLYILRPRLARLRWLLAMYCAFSVLFFSSHMFSNLSQDSKSIERITKADVRITNSSPLQALPGDHLLSKLSSLYPPPLALQPFVLQAVSGNYPVTACLWATADDIDSLPMWVSRWKGAISLLVTTMHPPSTPAADALIGRLRNLHNPSSVKYKVSIHILYLAANTLDNSNAFLNLARLFAQTKTVALFPGNLSAVPPKAFYRSVASVVNSPKPVVFTMRQRTTYPFTSLSPVLLSQENPVWCTERFFPQTTRGSDWTKCLWQLWLDSYGDILIKPTTDWIQESRVSLNASSIEVKLHRRLSLKYRSETCVLAVRQLAALRSTDRSADAIKARWLKGACREWAAAKDN
ncbi:hypothetical protein BC629DRAFT_1436452 [Irpex lacteus]|nr:hypothetical protein BC629DRAFT_1436452 [Irpex lacteus]